MAGSTLVAATYPALIHHDEASRHRSLERLAACLDGARVVDLLDIESREPDATEREVLSQAEVALAVTVPPWLLDVAPRLGWIQVITTGVDHLDLTALHGTGIRLATGAGTGAPEIAEFVLARVLEHWKRLPELAEAQAAQVWQPLWGRSLVGTRAVLVGYGPINQEVARRLAAFGVQVTAVRRSADQPSPGADEVVALSSLDDALAGADIVVSALPSTTTTEGLFGANRFACMKPGAFFCNVGRGSAVDEPALRDALAHGRLSGAALDVTATEPLPPGDDLWSSSARLSPHCSTIPEVALARVHELVRVNLGRYRAGLPLVNELELGAPTPQGADR